MPNNTVSTRVSVLTTDSDRFASQPDSVEAEQSVLAACMLSTEAAEELVVMLKPENFSQERHRTIFQAICDLKNENIPVDPISLADHLESGTGDQLKTIGGISYLIELTDNTFALASWAHHAEIVKRTALLRDLIAAAENIRALAFDAPDDPNQVVEDAERELFNATEKRVSSSFVKINSLIDDAFQELSELENQRDHIVGVPTGFKDVDDLFHGWRGGDLVVLAARPGIGKTSLALNMAVNAARAGVTVVYFSLEMSSSQLVQRILCSEARVDMSKLRSGNLKSGYWNSLHEQMDSLSNLELYIDDSPGLSILEARAKARRQLRKVPEGGKGLIVVDYLQLMQPSTMRRDSNRVVEVGEISRGLKVLAKELDMPVLALSQLNRNVEARGKKRPMLSDLRESGSIEQDADIVMFIDRSMDAAEAEENDRPPLDRANLLVAKHRNGPTKNITLSFSSEYTKFGDWVDNSRIGD